METTSHANSLSDVLTTGIAEIEAKIRKEVEAELEAKYEAEKEDRLNEAIDQELAHFLPSSRKGGQSLESIGGVIDMEDGFFATQMQSALSDQWMPLTVQASAKDPTDADVKRALETLFLGAPVKEDFMAINDENSSLLLQVMQSCEQKAEMDPHGVSIVKNMTNYTIGTGVQWSCSVEEVEAELRNFDKRSKLPLRVQNMIRNKTVFGEHYFFLFVDKKTGDIYIRDRTKPYQIKAIKTHSEDAETRLAYGREKAGGKGITATSLREKYDWFADVNYFDQKNLPGGESITGLGARLSQTKLVHMVKQGDGFSVRGKPMMYPILRYLKYYEDFITDRIILNHERTKVVWIRKVNGNRGIPGGRAVRGPVGGQILTETPQIEWRIENATINASDVTEDGRLIRLAIAAASGIPEHILFQDPSQQVYASIRSSDTPFSQNIRAHQQCAVDDIETLLRVQIREKVKAKVLPQTSNVEVFTMESQHKMYDEVMPMVREGATRSEIHKVVEELSDGLPSETMTIPTVDVPIEASFPDVVQQDPLDMARESEVLDRIGIFSKTELAQKHGGNYKRTAMLKNQESNWVEEPEEDENTGKASYGSKNQTANDNDNNEQGENDK